MVMNQYGIVTERWHWTRKYDVKMWLVENFGVNGDRWGEEYDYGLENLWMNEDVYLVYLLKWT
jgi:hypothetical protein